MLVPLLLAATTATVDGAAALEHASRLAALGPHPFGSTLSLVAAEYVASELSAAGLSNVHLQRFQSQGITGANVVGTLRAPGPELVVVAAHHDTTPSSPGAYDDSGGVGILIEVARVMAKQPARPRTVVFVSFDGEERGDRGGGGRGSRAYVKSIAHDADDLIGALVIEMSGWSEGTPCLHPLPYADSLRPGRYRITPGWYVDAVMEGSRAAGSPLRLMDPRLSWLAQPMLRTLRVPIGGDDGSFTEARLPAAEVSDSSITAIYPWYHQPADTADKLDATALARMGQAVLGAVAALQGIPRGPVTDPTWFGAGGEVWGETTILGLGLLSLVPGLWVAFWRGGFLFVIRLTYTLLVAVLLFRHPVPVAWLFVVPGLVLPFFSQWWAKLVALTPLAGLVIVGTMAWRQGLVAGTWWAPWEIGALGLALLLVWIVPRRPKPARRTRKRRRA